MPASDWPLPARVVTYTGAVAPAARATFDPDHNAQSQDDVLWSLSRLEPGDVRTATEAILSALRDEMSRWLAGGGYAPRWERYVLAGAYYETKGRR